jgi:hypothetical protein
MKRYFAFYGDQYYPERGMGDFIGSYESREGAIESIKNKHLERGNILDDFSTTWFQVFDSKKIEVIYEG